jgi:hypothetical protein
MYTANQAGWLAHFPVLSRQMIWEQSKANGFLFPLKEKGVSKYQPQSSFSL